MPIPSPGIPSATNAISSVELQTTEEYIEPIVEDIEDIYEDTLDIAEDLEDKAVQYLKWGAAIGLLYVALK